MKETHTNFILSAAGKTPAEKNFYYFIEPQQAKHPLKETHKTFILSAAGKIPAEKNATIILLSRSRQSTR